MNLQERIGEPTSPHAHVSQEYQDAQELWDEVDAEVTERLDNYPSSDEIQHLIAYLQSL